MLSGRIHLDEEIKLASDDVLSNKGLMAAVNTEYLLQFSHSSNNPRDDIATEAYEDELDMGRSGSYLNSSINSAWSEHSLDPEDIRVRPEGPLFSVRSAHTDKCVWMGRICGLRFLSALKKKRMHVCEPEGTGK